MKINRNIIFLILVLHACNVSESRRLQVTEGVKGVNEFNDFHNCFQYIIKEDEYIDTFYTGIKDNIVYIVNRDLFLGDFRYIPICDLDTNRVIYYDGEESDFSNLFDGTIEFTYKEEKNKKIYIIKSRIILGETGRNYFIGKIYYSNDRGIIRMDFDEDPNAPWIRPLGLNFNLINHSDVRSISKQK